MATDKNQPFFKIFFIYLTVKYISVKKHYWEVQKQNKIKLII